MQHAIMSEQAFAPVEQVADLVLVSRVIVSQCRTSSGGRRMTLNRGSSTPNAMGRTSARSPNTRSIQAASIRRWVRDGAALPQHGAQRHFHAGQAQQPEIAAQHRNQCGSPGSPQRQRICNQLTCATSSG